jgi:hypothetical protein
MFGQVTHLCECRHGWKQTGRSKSARRYRIFDMSRGIYCLRYRTTLNVAKRQRGWKQDQKSELGVVDTFATGHDTRYVFLGH